MRHYSGSIAFDQGGRRLAVSCLRDNLITFWDAQSSRLLDQMELADGGGVAPADAPGAFVITRARPSAAGQPRARRPDASRCRRGEHRGLGQSSGDGSPRNDLNQQQVSTKHGSIQELDELQCNSNWLFAVDVSDPTP
jgi:hypothetical protein